MGGKAVTARVRRISWTAAGAAIALAGALTVPRLAAPGTAAAPSWMKANAAHKSVSFTMNAADGGANGTLNFNGYADGAMTVTVPVGWRVHVDFYNTGAGALPHSLEVIQEEAEAARIPMQGVAPAIPKATTSNLIAGIPPQQKDSFDFIAEPPGLYYWFCGVPTHGYSGMWDRLVISSGAARPAVAVK